MPFAPSRRRAGARLVRRIAGSFAAACNKRRPTIEEIRMRTLICSLAACCLLSTPAVSGPHALPRFTEEREAAALHFVKKHLPELLPLLTDLKKTNLSRYHQE